MNDINLFFKGKGNLSTVQDLELEIKVEKYSNIISQFS